MLLANKAKLYLSHIRDCSVNGSTDKLIKSFYNESYLGLERGLLEFRIQEILLLCKYQRYREIAPLFSVANSQ
jgi:hypothetical protein